MRMVGCRRPSTRLGRAGGGLAFLLVLASPLQAQSNVRTAVDTTVATVGGRVTLTVSVEHPAGSTVVWPDSVDLDPFEVLAARAVPMVVEGARARSAAVFSVAAFELGTLEIPSFDIDVLAPDGSRETLGTDRFGIEVVTVGADDTGDIREIRGPYWIAVGVMTIVLWGLVLLALALLIYFAVRRLRRRDPSAPADVSGPPPKPAHEIALEALARLEATGLLERGEVKEYHIAVSDILRRYVEARFHVAALEMTTWEIVEGLQRVEASTDFREGLRGFLDRCDLVKFAKVRPNSDASREVLALGRTLVERSSRDESSGQEGS